MAADAVDKGLRAAREQPPGEARTDTHTQASASASAQQGASPAAAVVDTLLWQGLASVAVPGLTINRAVWAATKALEAGEASKGVVRAVPTAVGLGLIPFIVAPIDHAVEAGMDRFVRPALFPPGAAVAAIVGKS